MLHIKERVTSYIDIKKSKFYGVLIPINDDKLIKDIIVSIKKEYPSASHYCYGCIINGNYRSNDDGEPSSTAGKPILECLKNKELDNVICVVVRYFGGTLLGTAGLVKAYQQATLEAIAMAKTTIPTVVKNYKLCVDFVQTNKIENILTKNAIITNRQYGEQATYYYQCETDISNLINELTSGNCEITYLSEEIIEK